MRLEADRISWSVGSTLIVDGVSLTAEPGQVVGLLGPNGSGKSSLLRVIAGLRPADDGDVRMGEDEVRSLARRTVARRMAFVEQSVVTDQDFTVADVVDLGRIPHRRPWSPASARDAETVRWAAEATGVVDHLDRQYATLSGGERQRVQLARALAQEPSILLLDEPTNHLDIAHQLEILRLVRESNTTVVVALHDLNLAAAYCDRVVVLNRGRAVAAGPPAEVLTEALISEVYGVRARVVHDDEGSYIRYLAH
ncbi:MAG: ABC transporter ATP-binding protein [Gordonia sp. (in: high G+C Gram-positive bacteria)]|uniref:ABC transporter ATP-binding protein n=1 Tax=Gordonia sp. (in: high G+C Gram-positive bacteria) TaxID=84139 RepID=UPI0039E262BE